MVRCGGLGYTIDVGQRAGHRISNLTLLASRQPLDANKSYIVAGWASVNQGTEGPPVWDLVENYIARKKSVRVEPSTAVKALGT
jgi:S-sulfosulfanyl-L-cysteine sulfohydrolase